MGRGFSRVERCSRSARNRLHVPSETPDSRAERTEFSLSPSAGPAAPTALGNQLPCLLVKTGYLSSSLHVCIPGVRKGGSGGERGPCSLRRCTRIPKQCFWPHLLRNALLRPCLAGGMAGKCGL